MSKNYLTKAAFDKLANEIEHLKGVRRREIAEQLAIARSFGDLSENAEYEAAKHAMNLNETRISDLEMLAVGVEIVSEEDIPADKVYLGACVKVLDLDFDEEETWHIVSTNEADPSQNKISTESPVGKGMLGHGVGAEVEIEIPRGKMRLKILEITRS